MENSKWNIANVRLLAVLMGLLTLCWSCSSDDDDNGGSESDNQSLSGAYTFTATEGFPDWQVDWVGNEEAPKWESPAANLFEERMYVIIKLSNDYIDYSTNEDRMAVFVGDECRGVVTPKQMRGAAYVAMSVYGTAQQTINGQAADLDKDQPVTFRIWDAATGMTYSNINIGMGDGSPIVTSIPFDPTVNYGNFDKPLIFTKSNLVEQPLNIRAGWNWLSLGVNPNEKKISEVFKDLVSWNAQLKDKSTGVAYCRGSYWMGSLKEVDVNTMYKLQLTRMEASNDLPQPLIINGEQVKLADMPVKISKDWNWIAFTPLSTMPIGQALAGANPQFGDQVKSQTGFAYYGPYGWEGNLEALESGRGYLYFSTDDKEKSFVYPTISSSTRSRNAAPTRNGFPRTRSSTISRTRRSTSVSSRSASAAT